MLIRFNVKNFLSFDSRNDGKSEEFSMIAGKTNNKKGHLYDGKEIKLLKLATVYGANASGKSNLVKAIDFMKNIIVFGVSNLKPSYSEKYCKINPKNKDKASYFEMEILLNNKYYAYGFEIILNQFKIISEWLVELHPNGEDIDLFSRDVKKGVYDISEQFSNKNDSDRFDVYDKLNMYADDIKKDTSALFLNIMNRNKQTLYDSDGFVNIIQRLFLWFKFKLDVNYPNRPVSDILFLSKFIGLDKIKEVLSGFGTGITNLRKVDISFEKALQDLSNAEKEIIISKIEKEKINHQGDLSHCNIAIRVNSSFLLIAFDKEGTLHCQTIEFEHNKNKAWFKLDEESDGTVRILDLLEILIAGESKTYVLDELDRCLHPNLTYKFIETFLKVACEQNIQLIVTTHESRLLDFNLLRRDEVWFINKNKFGASNIYSLDEYNTRFDQKIDMAYLEGRYGGVPIFNKVFPIEE